MADCLAIAQQSDFKIEGNDIALKDLATSEEQFAFSDLVSDFQQQSTEAEQRNCEDLQAELSMEFPIPLELINDTTQPVTHEIRPSFEDLVLNQDTIDTTKPDTHEIRPSFEDLVLNQDTIDTTKPDTHETRTSFKDLVKSQDAVHSPPMLDNASLVKDKAEPTHLYEEKTPKQSLHVVSDALYKEQANTEQKADTIITDEFSKETSKYITKIETPEKRDTSSNQSIFQPETTVTKSNIEKPKLTKAIQLDPTDQKSDVKLSVAQSTSGPIEITKAPPPPTPQLATAVKSQIHAKFQHTPLVNGTNVLKITLRPPELGSLHFEIRLNSETQQNQAKIIFDNPETMQLFKQDGGEPLGQILKNAGYKLDSENISYHLNENFDDETQQQPTNEQNTYDSDSEDIIIEELPDPTIMTPSAILNMRI
jgi:flagellar hook-length control protein FliK